MKKIKGLPEQAFVVGDNKWVSCAKALDRICQPS
jgi:hypothetical protein